MEKPLRYINHEINAVHKDFNLADVRFCLIYPDVYELGISHYGLKILYTIINGISGAMADRAYAPWIDLGQKLKKSGKPLKSIESKTPINITMASIANPTCPFCIAYATARIRALGFGDKVK